MAKQYSEDKCARDTKFSGKQKSRKKASDVVPVIVMLSLLPDSN